MQKDCAFNETSDWKFALFTGAARGIGKGFAAAYLREGATVAIGDTNIEAAEKTAAELGRAPLRLLWMSRTNPR